MCLHLIFGQTSFFFLFSQFWPPIYYKAKCLDTFSMSGLVFMNQWINSIHAFLFFTLSAFARAIQECISNQTVGKREVEKRVKGRECLIEAGDFSWSVLGLPVLTALSTCPSFPCFYLRAEAQNSPETVLLSYCSLCVPFYSYILPPFWPLSSVISSCLFAVCEKRSLHVRAVCRYMCQGKEWSCMRLIVLWGRGYLWFKEDRDRKSMKEEVVKGKIWSFLSCAVEGGRSAGPLR